MKRTGFETNLSPRACQVLLDLANVGSSEARAVAETLLEIAGNDAESARDEFLVTCAEEIRDWAQHVIGRLGEPTPAPISVAAEVYQTVLAATESFHSEDRIGGDLAYLLGAMATGERCQWKRQQPIVGLLERKLTPDHPVWGCIELLEE